MKTLSKAVVAIGVSLLVLSTVARADALDPGTDVFKVDAAGAYVYQQGFMPRETVEIDLSKTAMFVTDPQNDFLSEKSPAWGLVGDARANDSVTDLLSDRYGFARQHRFIHRASPRFSPPFVARRR